MVRGKLRRIKIIKWAVIFILIFPANMAWALPNEGTVVAGSSAITQTGSKTMSITQTTDKSIINWQGYSIAADESVQYIQPGTSSISLNRVTGADPSVIYGHLTANGRVWVINPNGLLVGQNAKINVGSFLGSTLNIDDNDFLDGNYKFVNYTDSLSSIINAGDISTAPGGYLVFISPSITNTGNLTANAGKVYLASGNEVTLNFAGTDLIGFTIDRATAEDALGIKNTGTIIANGGEVILAADIASSVLKEVVNNEGIIQAQTIEEKNGVIKLLGVAENNVVHVGGTLDASAPNGGNGGFIETSAAVVKVADEARVTTFAPEGSYGTWLIDPQDYTVAASGGDITGANLSINLGTTSVILQSSEGSTAGSGNVNINDNVSWSANTTLTLTASNNVNVNSNITATGNTAGLVISPNTANGTETASGTGVFNLDNGAIITLSGTTPSLSIGGISYTVINEANGGVTALQNVNSNLAGYYALGTDIDASATSGWNSGAGFSPIGEYSGSESTTFHTQFNGLNHTVSNLYINRPLEYYVGLFGYIGESGAVSNLGITGGSITGADDVGSLAGVSGGSISNSFATADVTGNGSVGGLIGHANGSISNSFASGSVVNSGDYTGGLLGSGGGDLTITNCYATGNVTGTRFVGGLIGLTNGGSISYAYATGSVTGEQWVAGLIADFEYDPYNMTGPRTIDHVFATGEIILVGTMYHAGVGGLFGDNKYGIITNAFWNPDTAGILVSGAIGYDTMGTTGIQGVSTAQLQVMATFSGWDISNTGGSTAVWRIYEGDTFPLLRSFLTPLTITADNISKTYDGLVYSGSLTNVNYSDSGAPSSGHLFGSPVYTNARNAGTYTPVGLWSDQMGYDIVYASGILTIDKAPLTITAQTYTKTYDGTTTVSAAPVVSGTLYGTDTITGLSEAYDNRNAGTGKTLSVTGYTVDDGNGGNNYSVVTVDDTSGVINPATLTITALANTKSYDGTTTVATVKPSVTGLITGDTVTDLSEVYDDKNVGTGKTMSVSGYTVNDGNSGNNYSVVTVDNTNGIINQATLTISAQGNTKTYDGTTSATALPVVSGLAAGDSVTDLSEAYTNANAGIGKTLSVTGYTLDDSNSGANYIIVLVDSHSGIINRAPLTITAQSNSKTYDGTTSASALPVVSGTLYGDDTVNGLKEAYTSRNAGTAKTLSVSGYTISDGNNGGNYVVTLVNDTTGVIGQAALTITAQGDTKTYDGTTSASLTPLVSGLMTGDTVTGLSETYDTPDVGTGKALSVAGYTINDGNSGSNYVVTVNNTTGIIEQAPLTVTANPDSRTYDRFASYSGGNGVTYSGFVNGETPSVIIGTLTYGGNSQGAMNVGSYNITPGGLTSGNYDIVFVNGILDITFPDITVLDMYQMMDGEDMTDVNGFNAMLAANPAGSWLFKPRNADWTIEE